MTEDAEVAPDADENQRPRMRRKWFPVLWVGIPAVVWAILNFGDFDPGLANSFAHGSVVAGILGLAAWVFFCSGWSRALRWPLALIPSALVVIQYAQLSPVELVTDGDVAVVGWRWRADAPDRLLDDAAVEVGKSLEWQTTPNDYPRFLGDGYWAEVKNVALDTDWTASPPREVWRNKIGAGWSAFAIVGDYAITQEQRDENELVTCYSVKTGDLVWAHADEVRWDPGGTGALGYAGPRATPTVYEGKVFSHGATGIVNCLDARTGELLWSHDTLEKHGATNVHWGKSGSPLIVDDMVVVSVGGPDNQSVVAYKIESGNVAWASGKYQSSYASPVLAELAGVRQVLSVDEGFVTSRRADDGKALWEFPWPSGSGSNAASSQPLLLSDDRVFVSKGYGLGSALMHVSRGAESGWQIQPAWRGTRQYGEKPVLKTKMGNVVIHNGFVYGLDDIYLQCVELETGKKKWKERRKPKIGHGQIMLIGDVILVLSEQGELILVEASPEDYNELANLQAFPETQITWNNPAFSFPYLLVRNAEEAVCYELSGETLLEVAQKK